MKGAKPKMQETEVSPDRRKFRQGIEEVGEGTTFGKGESIFRQKERTGLVKMKRKSAEYKERSWGN